MAAGQHRDSRRRGFDLYSRKENFQYRYAGPDAESRSHDESVECKNFLKSWTLERKVDVSVGRTQKGGLRGVSSSNGFSDAPVSVLGIKSKGTSTSEDGAELPPRKKGKFSPIIWDKKEKEVRISSKNRVTRTVGLSPPILPPKPYTRVSEGSSDGPNSECLPPTNMALRSEAVSGQAPEACGPSSAAVLGLLATSDPMSLEDDNEKGTHMEKEDVLLTRSISMSRWASDSDSPRVICQSYDGCLPKREEAIHHMDSNLVVESERSSPESGEFLGQSSGGVSYGSSVSDDGHFVGSASRDCSGNESFDDHPMGIDGQSGNDCDADQMASDSEDGIDSQPSEEPRLPVERDMNMLQGCRNVSEYEKLNRISEGTYGVVYRARDKKTREIVALKKVKMGMEEGFPLSALREINILLSFHHPSVVDVKEVVMGDLDSIFMVMEYMEHDLKGVMEKMKYPFSTSEVKCLMLQLLEGVKYLHDNWVLHRDLKTSNLLLNNKGELKVCDLGMARQYGIPPKPYTQLVVTLWYRAPELLLGAKQYSTSIDMWSVGCIMAEFLAKKPLFAGETEVSQLNKIFEVLGTPNESTWPGYSELPGPGGRVNFKAKQPYSLLRKKFPAASFTGAPALSESGFDLLSKLLTYDPEKRISADDALDHDWFKEVPLPKSKDFMPTFPPSMPRAG